MNSDIVTCMADIFENMSNLCWSSIILSMAALFSIIVYGICGWRHVQISFVKSIERHLFPITITIIVLGAILYGWGYWGENNSGNLIVLLPKVIVSTLGMFVSTSDIVDLKSDMKDDVLFMTLFTIVHFTAVLLSVIVILKVLGYKTQSYLAMLFRRPANDVYIFWGINDNSLMLAESIHKKYEKDATIIFVELPCADKYEYNPLVGLFNKNSIQRASIYRMENIGAYLARAGQTFHDICQDTDNDLSPKDLYVALGLKTLSRFIGKSHKIQFYFLSDAEQENMDNLMDLIKFYGVGAIDKMPVDKVYSHARRNSLNSIVSRASNKIQIADSSQLSVLQLMKNVAYHPANFVTVDTSKAIVLSEFNALIVGFGETGRDAFNFLYEFSSFVGPDGELNPRKINVVDAKLSERKTLYLNNCPALCEKEDICWWDDMSVDSQAFWNKYHGLIDSLNYVVITLNDDKMASDLAVKMYQMAYRYRKDLERFKIFVRLKDSDSEQLLAHVSNYYRDGSDRDDKGTNALVAFGTYRKLFDIKIFDTDVINSEADKFKNQYNSIVGGQNKVNSRKHVSDDVEEDYKNQQNISNVRHVDTKLILAGAFCSANKNLFCRTRKSWLLKISKRVCSESQIEIADYINAPLGSEAYTLMENLSLCEHLRWNAKMELMGFVPYPSKLFPKAKSKDNTYKTHHCIVSCKELNEKFQSAKVYDWAVVELSFRYHDNTDNDKKTEMSTEEFCQCNNL